MFCIYVWLNNTSIQRCIEVLFNLSAEVITIRLIAKTDKI